MLNKTNKTTVNKLNPRRREARPERIDIGSDILVRNDVIAAQYGMVPRTINKGDRQGAPYTMIAHCKYRPERAYGEFQASQIQAGPARRRGRR
jgi:hypothetical protein